MERRKFERVGVHEAVLVELAAGDVRLAAFADLSEGGAFVARVSAIVGQRVVVHVRCSDADWSASVGAIVRWASSDGVGVQFRDLDDRGVAAVNAALVRARRPSHARQRSAPRAQRTS